MPASLPSPFLPMEAVERAEVPEGPDWQYEPKWDGFRCVAIREGDVVRLQSKAGKPLERYFPDVVETVLAVRSRRFVLDGEIVVPIGDGLSFDDLLQRIHPAKSRVARLAAERPAAYVAFDLLEEGATPLLGKTLAKRRPRLERFAERAFAGVPRLLLSPATLSRATALRWLEGAGRTVDGVVAKRLSEPYRAGERAMVKVKRRRTADCVVGGYRLAEGSERVGSILLGLYDDAGLLHHVGFTSSIPAAERVGLEKRLRRLREGPGFTGKAPGGPSRWSDRSGAWEPVAPRLVVEVEFDHATGGRFRHGTRFLRWRPDKDPRTCDFGQIAPGLRRKSPALPPSRAARPRARRTSPPAGRGP